jgi:hypothetical protein
MIHKLRPATAAPVQELLSKATETAAEIGQEITNAAAAKIEEAMHGAQEQLQTYSKDVWREIQESRSLRNVIGYTRAKPLNALLLTLGLGIVVGMGVRR